MEVTSSKPGLLLDPKYQNRMINHEMFSYETRSDNIYMQQLEAR